MNCRLCDGQVRVALELKPTPIANSFPDEPNSGTFYPLDLHECQSCGHVQIGHIVPDAELYGRSYKYHTPKAQLPDMREQANALRKRYPNAKSVLEIGANNGMFLGPLRDSFPFVAGIDPSGGDGVIKEVFSSATAFHADLIVAKNVLAHVQDLNDVFKGISKCLSENGSLVFEVQYFMDMAQNGLFDMIYHEHRDYHTVRPLSSFLAKHGLNIIDVERIPSHGGSIRVHCGRGKGINFVEPTVDWRAFHEAIMVAKDACLREIDNAREQIVAFGATAKSCTLIHQLGVADKIAYCVDNTPEKHGKYIAGTKIKIYPEETLERSKSPKVLLLTAWNYEDIIRPRYPDFDFIVPFGKCELVAA